MFYRQNKITLWQVLLFLTVTCVAATSQVKADTKAKVRVKASSQQVIDISAKTLLLDQDKGISEYKGNVLFKQNTLVIKADTISLYYKDKKLEKALITGSPADVQQHPDNEAEVHSQAEKMEYFVEENRLVLTGNAFVTQGSRHFSGQQIVYDTRQGTLTAAGTAAGTAGSKSEGKEPLNNKQNNQPNERVHVIIGPTENDKESP